MAALPKGQGVFLPPFKAWLASNIPAVYDNTMTYYEELVALIKYLQDIVVPAVNDNASAVTTISNVVEQLQSYVENYFANLDVQEEINNKLDQMAEDGQLADIISQYLDSTAVFGYDNVAGMKAAPNLVNGSYARTLGYYAKNDGGGALYKIRTITNDDVIDESFIIEMGDSENNLIAELQFDKEVNVKALGCKADKTADTSTKLQNAINKLENATLFFPHGAYKCDTYLTAKSGINFRGEFKSTYTGLSDEGLFFDGTSGITNCSNNRIEGMVIQSENYVSGATTAGISLTSGGTTYITDTTIVNFGNGVQCNYHMCVSTNLQLHGNNNGVINPVDSRFTNCTVNANHGNGFVLLAGANDNVISESKIEWNEAFGIAINGTAYNNVICSNVIDRNSSAGITVAPSAGNTTITTNVLRRNGATASGVNSTNIYLNNCPNVIVSNNTTAVGHANDDDTGDIIPTYALYAVDFGTSKLMLLNNQLSGGTATNPVNLVRTTNVTRVDKDAPIYEALAISSSQSTASANGGTATYSITFPSEPAAYAQGVFRKLVITARSSTDSTYVIKETYAMLYRQFGTYHISFTDSTIRENLTLTGSYDSTNGGVITVTNATNVDFQTKITVYAC